jgi:xanthine dehydrogenase molybdenum-binding subunit
LPGVHAVLAADVPYHTGLVGPVAAADKVRSYRDEIAAVAADSAEIAEAALKLIEVEYEDRLPSPTRAGAAGRCAGDS